MRSYATRKQNMRKISALIRRSFVRGAGSGTVVHAVIVSIAVESTPNRAKLASAASQTRESIPSAPCEARNLSANGVVRDEPGARIRGGCTVGSLHIKEVPCRTSK